MSTKPKILVTSAAGNTGLPTALQLLDKGYPVRALVRRDDRRAARLRAAGADVYVGNQYALADMRRAMAGVQRVDQTAEGGADATRRLVWQRPNEAEERHEGAVLERMAHPREGHPSPPTRPSSRPSSQAQNARSGSAWIGSSARGRSRRPCSLTASLPVVST